jgi:hypothetical protein
VISPVGGFNPEAKAFRDEVKAWSRGINATAHFSASFVDGYNLLLRYRLQLKNVANLKDEQVPEARELFEQYKQLIKPGEVSR